MLQQCASESSGQGAKVSTHPTWKGWAKVARGSSSRPCLGNSTSDAAAHGGLLWVLRVCELPHPPHLHPPACRKPRPIIGAEGKRGVHLGTQCDPRLAVAAGRARSSSCVYQGPGTLMGTVPPTLQIRKLRLPGRLNQVVLRDEKEVEIWRQALFRGRSFLMHSRTMKKEQPSPPFMVRHLLSSLDSSSSLPSLL